MAMASSSTNYDPLYCLNEHLKYFNENVVANGNFLETDFDEIFGNDFVANFDVSHSEPLSTQMKQEDKSESSPFMTAAPASPKSVIDREAHVVSPTTVTSMHSADVKSMHQVEKPKPKSRKRTISEAETDEESECPKDHEDIRR